MVHQINYNGAKTVIIVPPICYSAIRNEDIKDIKRMRQIFEEVINECENIEYYDFTESIKDNICFCDYEHLNENGRLRFTNILNQTINEF